MEYVGIPVISLICYLIGEFFKLVILKKKTRYKYIPLIVGVAGGCLGLILYFTFPEMCLCASNPFIAVGVGIVSGIASTGGNELIMQFIKNKKEG
ncbi:MAG: phage holin family protein [Anaeroplasmataceae bacterium]|nr:phage holin family protein [Anaeroplasmataceae bacterium]